MNPVQGQAFMMAGVVEFTLAAMSVLMIVISWRVARGGLARNPYVGLRTPSTMRSDQAWIVGHRAAAHTAPLYLLFNTIMCASLGAAAWRGWRLVVAFIGGGGFFALIGLIICTAVIASRAARAADDHTDQHGAAGYSIEMADIATQFSGRAMTIIGWICALAVSAATALLLGTILDGYVLSIHHQLQPNPTFGFRDETAFSCRPRGYAAQIAGFSWLLFGYGPVAAAGLAVCTGAAIQRRSPWDIYALAMATVLLAIIFVVAAGIHADNVARAITCGVR
jgi:hypothetical protein